jgi:hypothetical protein
MIVSSLASCREAIQCFREAEKFYSNRPEVVAHIRTASVRCQQQLQDSIQMLRKVAFP